jgi:hypothetical protein
MDKKKTTKQSPKATLAEVTKEMAKPRVAMSARGDIIFFGTLKSGDWQAASYEPLTAARR